MTHLGIKAIVFDFDNVIALRKDGTGSDEIKDAVWPEVFGSDWVRVKDEFPAILQRWKGGKGSRSHIVRDVLSYLHLEGDLEKEVQKYCEIFNRLVQKGIGEMGILTETRDFLGALSKRFPLFLSSATPTVAMNETLEKLGILDFFREVYGQEGGKVESLRSAMKAIEETDPQKILFVGDALTDYEAARAVGTLFVGVATKRNKWKENPQIFPVVSAVYEIAL